VALLTGSGEPLTASRMPAFTRCDASALPPPTTAIVACCTDDASPAISNPMTAPTVGRIAVEIVSHTESTYGILSVTNSIAYITAAATSTSVRISASGTSSAPSTRP